MISILLAFSFLDVLICYKPELCFFALKSNVKALRVFLKLLLIRIILHLKYDEQTPL